MKTAQEIFLTSALHLKVLFPCLTSSSSSSSFHLAPPLEVISSRSFLRSFLHFSISTTFKPSTEMRRHVTYTVAFVYTGITVIRFVLVNITGFLYQMLHSHSTLFSSMASLLVTSVFNSLMRKAL